MRRADRGDRTNLVVADRRIEREESSERRSADTQAERTFGGKPVEGRDDVIDHPGIGCPSTFAVATQVEREGVDAGGGEQAGVIGVAGATTADPVQDDDAGRPGANPPDVARELRPAGCRERDAAGAVQAVSKASRRATIP